ncbi:BOI-related E3 ubiquitin-protein ligase 1-like [Andrographis paniculata]|uniref:BOI-related E3 ubiquitin-protein ligase 1-like n=1 Tax=Andrographis paniculata TaxID=175694 RepID=UPI0021E975C1|nr:BOI-related E3 ubiquitin-protein ligase 1-like [Andrographis paniculata]
MAVEARHLSLFPTELELIQDRNMLNSSNQANFGSAFNSQQMRCLGIPLPVALPENQSFYPAVLCDSAAQAKTSVNTDSGLTCNISASRKRPRDSSVNLQYATQNFPAAPKDESVSQFPSFGDEDVLPQFLQHQLEIDAIITQHAKKIRLELEQRQKQQARLLAAAIGEGVMKKLKEKDEQIQRIGKLNLVLQERVKSLYVENQLLRDLAQTNQATANSLRTNLEQVLLHVGSGGGEEHISAGAVAVEDDAESCCGSSDEGEADKDEARSCWKCRRCAVRESCVLLLPCRHLCLCNVCGSGSQQLQACPACNLTVTATLHVNTC